MFSDSPSWAETQLAEVVDQVAGDLLEAHGVADPSGDSRKVLYDRKKAFPMLELANFR